MKGLGTVTNTLADKDKQLGDLIDNFAGFTSTLETRETQLGQVMDLFAQTTSLLAQERGTIAGLIHGLIEFSELVRSAANLIGAIPPDALSNLLHQAAIGLNGRTDSLRQLAEGATGCRVSSSPAPRPSTDR